MTDTSTGELPDWARQQISDANAEAAKYRTQKREAVQEYSKLRIAVEAGIPADKVIEFAKLLQGDTDDEIAAHAEQVTTLFADVEDPAPAPTPATDISQGTGAYKIRPLADPLTEAFRKAFGSSW